MILPITQAKFTGFGPSRLKFSSADLKVKDCSSDGSNRHKDIADRRSMSTRRASHVRLAHLGGLPLAQPQPSFELHNIAASYATLSTQSTHDCPPRDLHQTPKPTHLPTSTPSPEKRTATAFYVRLDRKPQVLRYVDRISPLRQAQTDYLPASTRLLGRPSLSLTVYVMVLHLSPHHVCQA
jgi:hypothetical protein